MAAIVSLNIGRKELVQKAANLIDTFDPKRTTVDAWIDDSDVTKDKCLQEVEKKFLHQVLYGCMRYQKFLKLFVTSFLYKCPTAALRTEQTLYTILGYLMFFRLEELGVAEFREMLLCGCGTMPSLLALLQYALSADDLEKWVKVEWCKIYDVKYIEEEVIGKLQGFLEEMRPLVEEVEFKATGTVKQGDPTSFVEKRPATEFKPFKNLTTPKPRLIPEPQAINREVKALPVPRKMINSTSLCAIEEEKRQRRKDHESKAAAKYAALASSVPVLRTDRNDTEKELEELTSKVRAEEMAECTFKPKVNQYVPSKRSGTAVVQHNIASVLREDALLKQKQAKEYEILKRYEEELHDASEFNCWQKEMREKDKIEEELLVQQRIAEMQMARENAIEAYDAETQRRKIKAAIAKEQLQCDLEQKARDDEFELKGKQDLVEKVQGDRDSTRNKEAEATKAKAEKAEQQRREKEAEFERKRLEDEQELEKRKDVIRQIRALEKCPVEKFRPFDPAEPPSQGLLDEMSLVELKERLQVVQARQAKETEEKRQKQLERKVAKQQELNDKAEMLARVRDQAREEARQRNAAATGRKQLAEEQAQQRREKLTLEVAAKVEARKQLKRQEEAALRKELKEVAAKRNFLQAGAAQVEARVHAEQHRGLEREARNRRKQSLAKQLKADEVLATEVAMKRNNALKAKQDLRVMREEVDERLRQAKAANNDLTQEIKEAAESARMTQRTWIRKSAADLGGTGSPVQRTSTARLSTSA
mmetsp:Transcript_15673/g.30813  ORF Transcript_15673/g.30813 Transcript_15673/m.30813 type:complete len:762 (-) Transcript_15673:154-2439(-)|eukprot:CAMPEP_0172730558 /NCGR_PEP_ID=MMETSP1074-20121228/98463_1 /TAXON_ID=2916 /ORGANISM="Ceratium fusus, Strain PA161109" /LENGTH=761 /DNA_ID=CAMNT_0013558329 /DNA_START=29 /DNA_END=2314 /DNA_ORIENTATION=+